MKSVKGNSNSPSVVLEKSSPRLVKLEQLLVDTQITDFDLGVVHTPGGASAGAGVPQARIAGDSLGPVLRQDAKLTSDGGKH